MRHVMRLVALGITVILSGPAYAGANHAGFSGAQRFGGYGSHPGGFHAGRPQAFGDPAMNKGTYARDGSNGFPAGGYATRAYAQPTFYRAPGAVTRGYATTRYSYGTSFDQHAYDQRDGYGRRGLGREGYGRALGYGLGGLGYGVGSYQPGFTDRGDGYAGYPTNFAAPGSYYPGGYGQDYGTPDSGYGLQTGGCTCR